VDAAVAGRGSYAIPTVPHSQSVVAVVDARLTRRGRIDPCGRHDAMGVPLAALLNENPKLKHVARPEIDLTELVALAAIKREIPFPIAPLDTERLEQHLLREVGQRLVGDAFDDVARREEAARTVSPDRAWIGHQRQIDERLGPICSLI